MIFFFFFFNDTATTEIYTLSLHDALPIFAGRCRRGERSREPRFAGQYNLSLSLLPEYAVAGRVPKGDRKSTRLNSSHSQISYAVFCLKKKRTHTFINASRSFSPTFFVRSV